MTPNSVLKYEAQCLCSFIDQHREMIPTLFCSSTLLSEQDDDQHV